MLCVLLYVFVYVLLLCAATAKLRPLWRERGDFLHAGLFFNALRLLCICLRCFFSVPEALNVV